MNTKIEVHDVIFLLLLLSVCILGVNILSEFKQLPGPIYGGDLYLHYGIVNHILDGGSPLMSSHFLGEYEHYPWLMHLSVALFSVLTGFSALKAMIYFPIVFTIIGLYICYRLGTKCFGSKDFGILLALAWTIANRVPAAVPTEFSNVVLLPLIPFALYNARDQKGKILGGLAYGLCGIGHVAAFLGANIFLAFAFFSEILGSHLKFKKSSMRIVNTSKIKETTKSAFRQVFSIFAIGFPISLLYWGPPLLVYQAKTLNPWQEYASAGVGGLTGTAVWEQVRAVCFNFSNVTVSILSILSILGIYYSLKNNKTALLVFFTGLVGFTHRWITKPLLGTSFGYYGFPVFFSFSKILLIVGGLAFLAGKIQTRLRGLLYILFALFLISSNFSMVSTYKGNDWTQVGKSMPPVTKAMFEIGDWAKSAEGTFLSRHDESSFALNALSGAKVVSMRRTHASPYVDVNKRIADKAVMLYGTNEAKVAELLKEYDVKYLFEDIYSAESVVKCTQVYEALSDPQYGDLAFNCLTTDPEYADYLEENGVEFVQTNMRLDPADERAPRFDMLAIKPTEINPYLASVLTTIKEATVEGQPVAVVMEITS